MRSTRRTALDELIETISANDRNDNDAALEHFITQAGTAQIFTLLERFYVEYRRKSNPWQFYIEYVTGKLLVKGGKLRAEDLFFIVKFSQRTKLLSDNLIVRIVRSQPLSTIDGLVGWLVEEPGTFDELLVMLLHEIVIEYSRLPQVICPNLVRAARRIEQIRHPLSVLPLALLSVESQIAPDCCGAPGLKHTRRTPPGFRKLPFSAVQPMVDFTLCEDTTAEYQIQAQSAFLNWTNQSNGCLEIRRFTSSIVITIDNIRQVLLGLNLACLNTITIETLSIGQTSATDITTVLFRCAANGGINNNSGLGSPYGRLAAWQSVTALVDALPGTALSVVNAQMETYQWFGLECNSPWFNHSACDLAFVGLNPEGTRLVTIAATDTN